MQKYYKILRRKTTLPLLAEAGFTSVLTTIVLWEKAGKIPAAIFAVILVIFAIFFSIMKPSGMERKLRKLGISEKELSADLDHGICFSCCAVGSRYALSFFGELVRLDDVVRAYPYVTEQKCSLTFQIRLWDKNGKSIPLHAESEKEMMDIFTAIKAFHTFSS